MIDPFPRCSHQLKTFSTCSASPNRVLENNDPEDGPGAFVLRLSDLDNSLPTQIAIAQFILRRDRIADIAEYFAPAADDATVAEQRARR